MLITRGFSNEGFGFGRIAENLQNFLKVAVRGVRAQPQRPYLERNDVMVKRLELIEKGGNGWQWQAVTGTLYSGDYSVRGLEDQFAVERKSVDDLANCCLASNRER